MNTEPITLTEIGLDTELALLRGWKWCRTRTLRNTDAVLVSPDILRRLDYAELTTVPGGFRKLAGSTPHFTTDIAAAWPLLEKMQQGGYGRFNSFFEFISITGDDETDFEGAVDDLLMGLSPLTIAQAYYHWRTGRRVIVTLEDADNAKD